jgi:hypothetical protein
MFAGVPSFGKKRQSVRFEQTVARDTGFGFFIGHLDLAESIE